MRSILGKLAFFIMLSGFIFYAVDGFGMDAKQRIAIVKGLKLKGIVGENNQGFLEFRTSDKSAKAVVDEENSERAKVYAEVAKKTGVTAAAVGSQRAALIASEESAGVWIQDAAGTWKQK